MKTRLAHLLIPLALAACDSLTAPGAEPERLLQTESNSYTLSARDAIYEVDIPYGFHNRTGGRVFVPNCNGIFGIKLQKEVGGSWVDAWWAAVPECLSPPIEIAEEAVFRDTLTVVAGRPGTIVEPKLEVEEIDGLYRLVWLTGLSSLDEGSWLTGDTLAVEHRVSNRFLLRAP